jgi:hypothetical protein
MAAAKVIEVLAVSLNLMPQKEATNGRSGANTQVLGEE